MEEAVDLSSDRLLLNETLRNKTVHTEWGGGSRGPHETPACRSIIKP